MKRNKHIYKTPNKTYAVRISRKIDGEFVNVTEIYRTLDEAIAARDKILETLRSDAKLRHSKSKRDRRLARAIERFGTEDIVEIKANNVSDQTLFVKRTECEICGADISRSHYFMNSTKCLKCNLEKGSEHQRLNHQKRIDRVESNKNNQLGIKNISYNTRYHQYCIDIVRNGKRFRAYAETLDEAILIKEKALAFFKGHGHLPDYQKIDRV